MIGIIGKKLGMTQVFNDAGQQIPCTVIRAEPNPVVQVMDSATHGVSAVQLGYGRQRERREARSGEKARPRGRRAPLAEAGHARKAGLDFVPRVLRSFRLDDAPGKGAEVPTFAVGQTVTVEIFQPGEHVRVTGTTKG